MDGLFVIRMCDSKANATINDVKFHWTLRQKKIECYPNFIILHLAVPCELRYGSAHMIAVCLELIRFDLVCSSRF